MTIEDSKYVKINSVSPLYLIISKINEYFKKINRNKFLTLISTNERKEIIKRYEELWSKMRYLIGPITKNSYDYNENI